MKKYLTTMSVLLTAALAGCSAATAQAPPASAPSPTAVATTTPSASPTLAPIPASAPKPEPVKPALYFSGDYRVVLKMTRTTHPGYYKKSKTEKTNWNISSECTNGKCRSAVDTSYAGEDFTLTYKSGHWRGTSSYKLHCVDTKTGKRAGPDVRERQEFDLKKTRSKGAIATRLEGTDHLRQLDTCGGRERTTFRVVLTHS